MMGITNGGICLVMPTTRGKAVSGDEGKRDWVELMKHDGGGGFCCSDLSRRWGASQEDEGSNDDNKNSHNIYVPLWPQQLLQTHFTHRQPLELK